MTDTYPRCQCEHADHDRGHPHPYLGVSAGDARAEYVGLLCDDCARGHLIDYVITPAAMRRGLAGSALTVPPATVPGMPRDTAPRPERHR